MTAGRLGRLGRVRRLLPVGAVLSGLLVSGCAGLPSSGPVQQGLGVDAPYLDSVRVFPDGPFPGDDAGGVVRGFLRAGAGFDNEHVVAKSFLSPAYARAWRPGQDVTVLRNASLQTSTAGSAVHVRASIVATIDGSGQYRELHVAKPLAATFRMQRVRGQWRIASAPRGLGLWLSTADLQRLYRAYAVYYAVPASKILIPDVRWLPLGSGLATSLARAQLAPVPGYLNAAVTSGVTSGTQLALEAVPVQQGVATVDLATPGLSADPALRQALWAQFTATLTQAPEVFEVSLEVAGSSLELPNVRGNPSSAADVGYAQLLPTEPGRAEVLRQGSTLRRVAGDGAALGGSAGAGKGAGPALPRIGAGWMGLALSPDGSTLAAVGGDRADLAVWRGTALTVAPRFARQLTRPSVDSSGWMWTSGVPLSAYRHVAGPTRGAGDHHQSVGRTRARTLHPAGAVYVADISGKGALQPRRVTAPWLVGRTVVALRVSADGQRAALVSRRAGGGDVRVQVSGIVRGSDGRPRSLDAPLRVGVPLSDATDLTWVADRTLAVLGRAAGSTLTRPFVVSLGGATSPLAPVPNARWISSNGDVRGILVTTTTGEVFEVAGAGWAAQGKGTDLAVAGG